VPSFTWNESCFSLFRWKRNLGLIGFIVRKQYKQLIEQE